MSARGKKVTPAKVKKRAITEAMVEEICDLNVILGETLRYMSTNALDCGAPQDIIKILLKEAYKKSNVLVNHLG